MKTWKNWRYKLIYVIKRWKSLSKCVFIDILNLGFFSKNQNKIFDEKSKYLSKHLSKHSKGRGLKIEYQLCCTALKFSSSGSRL